MIEVPRAVLPIWKFATKEVIRASLASIQVSTPEPGTVKFQASDGKAICLLTVRDGKSDLGKDEVLIPTSLWRKIPKPPRAKAITSQNNFSITPTGKQVSLGWDTDSMSTKMTASGFMVEGKFPDTSAVIPKKGHEPDISPRMLDSELIGKSIMTIKEIINGFGGENAYIRTFGYSPGGTASGLAMFTKGEEWEMIVVVMGVSTKEF